MKSDPKVAIILPNYNSDLFLKTTINSVLNQSYKNWQLIIVDDCSNQKTQSILKTFLKNKKIKIFWSKTNRGAAYCRNFAIKKSKSKYLAFIDSDDIWSKEKLSSQYNFMKKNKIKISHTSYTIINSNNKIIGFRPAKKIQNYDDLISSCDIGLSSVMLEKKILKRSKFSNQITKEDYSLWLNLAKKYDIHGLTRNLMKWRKSDSSLSSNTIQKVKDAFFIYFNQEKQGIFKSLISVIILSVNYLIKYKTTKK